MCSSAPIHAFLYPATFPIRVEGPGPSTRMGNVAGYRKAWIGAEEHKKRLEQNPNHRDIRNETLAAVLDGEILVHNHCYRAL